MNWVELNWNELNWIELNWIGMNWIELNWVELNWIGLDWIELNWIELNWIELDWIELNWIEMNWIELNWKPMAGGPWAMSLLGIHGAVSLKPLGVCVFKSTLETHLELRNPNTLFGWDFQKKNQFQVFFSPELHSFNFVVFMLWVEINEMKWHNLCKKKSWNVAALTIRLCTFFSSAMSSTRPMVTVLSRCVSGFLFWVRFQQQKIYSPLNYFYFCKKKSWNVGHVPSSPGPCRAPDQWWPSCHGASQASCSGTTCLGLSVCPAPHGK